MKKSTTTSVTHLGNRTSFTNDRSHGYECKTCKKRFDTFQALGGHQGTHKRVKFRDINDACLLNSGVLVPKLHQCKTCMKEFETGQALGGHMRRHQIEKALILVEKERLWGPQVVDKAGSDLILPEVELHPLKAEEDKPYEIKSELVLAAKEWRLSV